MSCLQNISPAFVMRDKCVRRKSKEIIENLCGLVEHVISSPVHERNLSLLENYTKVLDHRGLYLDEVNCLNRTISILLKYIFEVPAYKPLILIIIKHMASPLLLHESSDELKCKKYFKNYFNFFGLLLTFDHDKDIPILSLTSAIVMICKSYTSNNWWHVSSMATREALEKSVLSGIVAHSLEICSDFLFPYYLHLSILLIHKSPIICEKMGALKVINFCILKMYTQTEMDSDMFIPSKKEDIIEIEYVPYMDQLTTFLWGILMGLKKIPVYRRRMMNSPGGIPQMWCLRYFLRKSLLTGNQTLRNDIMGIILLIVSLFDNSQIIESGLSEDIAVLSMATEMPVKNSWLNDIKFEATNDDLKFKQMAILITCYCLKDVAYTQVINHYNVFSSYLRIINSRFETINIPWSRSQQKELLLSVLRAFTILVPVSKHNFITNNGMTHLLMLLEAFTVQPYDMEIFYAVCKTLNIIVGLQDVDFIKFLRSGITGDVLMSLCYYLLQNYTLNRLIQRILSFLFNILEVLVHRYPEIQYYPEDKSVDLSITVLQRFLKPEVNDAPISNKMFLCLGGFLWEAIGWTPAHLISFVNAGGVYMILDVIEKGIFPVQIVYLGILVELLDEGSCISQIITWRGGADKCTVLIPMLLSIYRMEEKRIGVQRQKNGAIYDEEFTIMGEDQWYETFYVLKDTNSSPAIIDLLISTRPKIYTIIHLLRGRFARNIKIANEHYKRFDESLTHLDQITMKIAGNFFALKLTEIWEEVRRDLQRASIIPLAIDYDNLSALITRHRKWGNHLLNSQLDIVEEYKNSETKKFNSLWTILKDNTLQTALEGLREMDFILRTSDIRFRLKQKHVQMTQANSSLHFNENVDSDNQHTTLRRNLNVDPVFNLRIQLSSTHLNEARKRRKRVKGIHDIDLDDNDFTFA